MPKNYMIGNWKMNQKITDVSAFFKELAEQNLPAGNFWIAPQIVHLSEAINAATDKFKIGSQNCSDQDYGAYTGETAAASLKELGAHFTLIGHSERRSYYGETNEFLNAKVKKALEYNLVPVLCIGETLEEREAGKTLDIVLGQVKAGLAGVELKSTDDLILAYEPVWAIGTGKTATPAQAQEVHAAIRATLKELYSFGDELSILYGGSVKPENVKELLAQPDISGGLVGGASLKVSDFKELCLAAAE